MYSSHSNASVTWWSARASSSRTFVQSGSGRAAGRDGVTPAEGYSRRANSASSNSATSGQELKFASLARRNQSATADLPHPTARAICRQLSTPPTRCRRRTSLIFCIASLGCATPSLLFVKKGRRMAVYKGLRRFDRCRAVRPGAGHAGHQSDMPDSIPLEQRNRPPSHWNAVRHHSGMLSAIIPESCPSWRGTRSRRWIAILQSGLVLSAERAALPLGAQG